MMWKFLKCSQFLEVYFDTTDITKENINLFNKILKNDNLPSKNYKFIVDFLEASTELREMLSAEDYVMLRDAEIDRQKGPISFTIVFRDENSTKFFQLIGLREKINTTPKHLLHEVHVMFVVNHTLNSVPKGIS